MKELIREYSDAAEQLLRLAQRLKESAGGGQIGLLQLQRRYDQLMEMYADTCFAISQMAECVKREEILGQRMETKDGLVDEQKSKR